nr:uncharacterized protein LOC113824482 [Penaeus vannamei]
MEIPALLLSFLLLSSNAFARFIEGESDRNDTREEVGETPSPEHAAPASVPAPPAAPPSPRRSSITRLMPVFMSSDFESAPGGVNGLYSPPIIVGAPGGGNGLYSPPTIDHPQEQP